LRQFIATLFFLIAVLPTVVFGQAAKVCIADFSQDSLRVSVNDIVKNPVIKICGLQDVKVVSYRLTLNINGIIYEQTIEGDALIKKHIQKLLEVRDDLPRKNQLFIEQVKYLKSDSSIETAKGLYLWITKETDCNRLYDIEEIKCKRKSQIRFEYFWCNDTCIKTNNYRKDGTLMGSKEYSYTPDTIVVTVLYRKDGSIIAQERQVNGKDDGDYFIFHPNGFIKLEAKNANGIRIREKVFDKYGKMISESNCNEKESNCTVKHYDKNGKVKKVKSFNYKGTKNKWVF
jgi:antitoxin component YwqK of YwqJK toxin-antitoxin module